MSNPVSDEKLDDLLTSVLLHSGKTRSFMKRLRAARPSDWQRVFGNVYSAHYLLAPRQETVTVYLIGVFNPDIDDVWPWHFDYANGVYLSDNHRLCKRRKAAEFTSKESARVFFHEWKGRKNLKMDLIEVKQIRTVEPFE